ncbi:MAG: hypothetical protein RR444_10710 [Oscillospiraceae bacterium]
MKRERRFEKKPTSKMNWKKIFPLFIIIIALFILTQKPSLTTERFSFEEMDRKMLAIELEPSYGLVRVSGELPKLDDLFVRGTEFSYDKNAAPHVEKYIDEDWVSYPVSENAQLYIVSIYENGETHTVFKKASLSEFKTHIEEYEKNKVNEIIPFAYFIKDGELIFIAEQFVS